MKNVILLLILGVCILSCHTAYRSSEEISIAFGTIEDSYRGLPEEIRYCLKTPKPAWCDRNRAGMGVLSE